ncbi:hypothetical protein CRG98_019978 [Punica granatum]|uniref:Reverse transcriptase domain-containing protein n=1 Tax=Punica granatum TaxID=22663 RepID=A0A2I0JTP2_PUNGR|nr:hypothetical protein CRG98_019978 [Punica granatum]
MYEEKSRGSGRGSRKTQIGGYGWVTRELAAATVRGKTGRHASSGHGTVQETGGKGSCARSVGPRIVTTSSREGVRVVRNPWNVMARLAEVVGGNGTRGGLRCARLGVSGPDLECLNDEDLNEPNIVTRRVNVRSGDSAPRECSGIVVISVFRGRALKARRETFMTTKTSIGKLSRVPEGLFWGAVCLSVERAPGALSEKAAVRDRGVPAHVVCPGKCLREPGPIYFGEGLDEDSLVPEIEESLCRLEDRQLISLEPTEEINVGTEEEPRILKIDTSLDPTQRAQMIDFLTRYQEVFAWSYANMPGLDPSIVKHFLPLDTEKFPPKRQQLRRQRASLLLRIKEEVVKQINAGYLEVCNYSEWVANIVPVEKKDGRVRVCVDYRDLNKASPKDNFPLPHIDILVDNTARHAQFSFMDGFSGYNQIRMAEEDKIKTTFTTMWGTFCYHVMPFGLKNAEVTYQRAMVTLFHDMMHKEVEVYVDDMIAKSKEGEDHLVNLKRLFDRLKEYKLRLNPAKCTFGARSGKLLGFVVSERGIEVDPDKVKAIKELPPPSSVREVRGFLERLNYIARFIANLTDKCQPLFRLLHKNAAIEWDEECQKAFDTIKAYMVQPPVLVSPTPDRPLVLYLTVRRQSLGCMLGQEEESTHTERAIYYLSKKFTDGESNYPKIEKMCCALVWVM